MGLFGSGRKHRDQVTIAVVQAADGDRILFIDGVAVGRLSDKYVLVYDKIHGTSVKDEAKAEALVGLISLQSGDNEQQIRDLVMDFRKSRHPKGEA